MVDEKLGPFCRYFDKAENCQPSEFFFTQVTTDDDGIPIPNDALKKVFDDKKWWVTHEILDDTAHYTVALVLKSQQPIYRGENRKGFDERDYDRAKYGSTLLTYREDIQDMQLMNGGSLDFDCDAYNFAVHLTLPKAKNGDDS